MAVECDEIKDAWRWEHRLALPQADEQRVVHHGDFEAQPLPGILEGGGRLGGSVGQSIEVCPWGGVVVFREFREFAMRGNVVDLAVGIIIGAAFGKIITSLQKLRSSSQPLQRW